MTKEAEPDDHSGAWERRMLRDIAIAGIQEQRRARRWGIFFKMLTFAYLTALLYLIWQGDYVDSVVKGKHTALVELKGVIAPGQEAGADNVVKGLRDAFENDDAQAVILRINSPGGSPVQAGYINDEMRRLREKYPDKPLYAVIADIAASGGYYVAVAADEIYADKASLIGSIGVRMDGFGFVGAMDKVGVERRLFVAGDHKALLDPFLPLDELEAGHIRKLLDDIHDQFIEVVKQGRGDSLAGGEELFSGLIWTGDESVSLGLVDALGSAGYVAREVVGEEEIVDYTRKRDWLTRLSDRVGAELTAALESGLFGARVR
ncbi:MAG: S49 family peptidase [Gammaproteobacteria bacterium]|nr:S49 family peptidase [Gammaproteobacteria bacterium]